LGFLIYERPSRAQILICDKNDFYIKRGLLMKKGDDDHLATGNKKGVIPELEEEIKSSLIDGRLPCEIAFKVAKKMKVSPREVGEAANRLKIKIVKCQLGCFP
jgi:hypothetical protein